MEIKLPEVHNLNTITPEEAQQYVKFVATLRHNQNRWFRNKSPEALTISKQMKKELDEWNGRLLNPVPSLFD